MNPIKDFQKRYGWKNEALAEALGVHLNTVQSYRSKGAPRLAVLACYGLQYLFLMKDAGIPRAASLNEVLRTPAKTPRRQSHIADSKPSR